ncbi:MAG: hypothetical protein J6U24_04160 [Paludibacteraceae bacterium]|nr:hypothetical protein [Paludibacteraceae bacterium]
MKYYLVKLLTNTAGQDAPSVDVYETLETAQVAYHNILAAYHNAEDVLFAVVEILAENGNPVIKEIVDHTPEPEPGPEPEVEGE